MAKVKTDRDYAATISQASRELTAKEKIAFRDFGNAVRLDDVLNDNDSIIVTPADYVVLDIHNEKAKGDKDYTKYIIISTTGEKYVTGSRSFFQRFLDIYDTMAEDAPGEEYYIECYKRPSKNYQGKSFISCSMV